jgi:DNA polymerase-1
MLPRMTAEPKKRIFLIDAMGYIFRAFHAPMERLRSPSGMPTKVPYLFATMLRRLLKDWQPDYLGVVFDVAAPTFRDALFAEYKAQRPPMPEDLSVQLPFVRRLCEAMRLPVLEYAGYEADDIIGALARQAAEKQMEVFVVTSDKDLLQLVGGPVRVLIPTKNDLVVDETKVEELLGVPPAKVPDVMALMGDAIDNIPGAKGIGEKGAKELIRRFGSVEAALDRAQEVESKRYREALAAQREQVLLSKKLATIATDVPVALDLAALARREADAEALCALYSELGFTSLLRDLAPAATPGKFSYEEFSSAAELRAWLGKLPGDAEAAVWLEPAPHGEDEPAFDARPVAFEIAAAGEVRGAKLDDQGEMLTVLGEWLSQARPPKIVHDPKQLELLLAPAGADKDARIAGIRHATMLYSYLLRPTTAKHSLADVVLRQTSAALFGAPGEPADALRRLAPALRAEVEAQELTEIYERIDLPLAPVLARMERRGVLVDREALAAVSAASAREIRALEQRIWELAGVEFNVNSPAQLAEILFDKMQLVPARRGRGGAKARSTSAGVLEELALTHELPRRVLEYRELSKLKSTYADALPRLIHPRTGRLHTSFSQTGTATGRLSSSNPNLQNIPVRTELGREIRAAFVAAPGGRLLSADYSQIELRILAHFSGDPVLVEAFRKGEDIHARTAQEVFGVGPLAQTPEHRRAAKAINFGIIYGLSAFGLAQQLGIEQGEAAKFIAAYFERYRGVKEYLDRQLEEVRQTGFTRTLFGRRRPIPEINSPQGNLRGFAERTALNTPLQGTAADLIKLAMIEIDRRLEAEGFRAKMILQVHDDLLFEAPEEELDRLRALVREAMEQVESFEGPLRVPLVVDLKAGTNWRDME